MRKMILFQIGTAFWIGARILSAINVSNGWQMDVAEPSVCQQVLLWLQLLLQSWRLKTNDDDGGGGTIATDNHIFLLSFHRFDKISWIVDWCRKTSDL